MQLLKVVKNRMDQNRTCTINEKPEGEGNRKDGEGQRGELFQNRRGEINEGREREHDRDSKETELNVPLFF